jgi:hypothetical protein
MSTRTAKVGGRLYHYYVCNRPAVEKRAGRCAQRCIRAVNFEDMVWRFVSDLLKHPDRIRVGIDKLVERERTGGSVDTEREALYWAEKVEECSHLRSAFQDQQAAGLMTLEELGSKLKELEQTRQVAEAEIAVLSAREERARQLEADRDSPCSLLRGHSTGGSGQPGRRGAQQSLSDAQFGGKARGGRARGQRGAV